VPVPEAQASPRGADRTEEHRKAFLLDQLLQATPDHKLIRREANKKIGAVVKRQLRLDAATANRVRDELAAQGFIRTTKKGQVVTDELTDEGRVYLQRLEKPVLPSRLGPAKVINENLRQYVKPYLLLQLLLAKDRCLMMGKANRFTVVGKNYLSLTPANARPIRTEMATEGLIDIEPQGRSERYRLKEAGVAFLACHDQYPANKVHLSVEALNALLRAARVSTTAPAPTYAPRPANLADAVLAEFEDLRREHHGHTGRVPLYQLRERFAAKYGPEVARHDVLDEPILQLWRERRARLVSLSDLQKATPEQLNASVPGAGETLFYMERPHE
jgi:predicted transcriptional regulator